MERRKRDLQELESQVEEDSGSKDSTLVKSNVSIAGITPVNHDGINDGIYRQINGLNDSAFVNILIIPTIVFASMFLFGLLAWLVSVFA